MSSLMVITDFPDWDKFKLIAKKLKGKEVWRLAREWAEVKEGTEPKVNPIHVFAVMSTRIRGDAHPTLITLGQRGDLVSRFVTASSSLTKTVSRVVCFSKREANLVTREPHTHHRTP